jgi:oligopeptide transport system ATP-binding protein
LRMDKDMRAVAYAGGESVVGEDRAGGKITLLLEIIELSKVFRVSSRKFERANELHALSNVNLNVYQGETLGVIGESGCGKSTLGRCIVGLHKPTHGLIKFKGQPLDYKGYAGKINRSKIQMIFQDPYSSLNPRKTCGSIVEEPLLIHKLIPDKEQRKKRVDELMGLVGLDAQYVHRYPHEFSGGQRQRINIARALALEPELLVCDEPVSALDVSIQAQVLNLFAQLQRELNLTFIFISHDLSVIHHISDRIAIMYLGQVVELCDAERIYNQPLHPYTQALLSAVPPNSPFEEKKSIILEGDIPSPIGERIGCPLVSRCPYRMERCEKECPELKDDGTGHEVACFLYEGRSEVNDDE